MTEAHRACQQEAGQVNEDQVSLIVPLSAFTPVIWSLITRLNGPKEYIALGLIGLIVIVYSNRNIKNMENGNLTDFFFNQMII